MIWVFSRKSHVLNNKAKAMQNLIQSNLSFKEFYIKHFPCIKPLKNFKFSLMILQWNLILQNSPLSNILWESKYTFIPKRANLCKRTIKCNIQSKVRQNPQEWTSNQPSSEFKSLFFHQSGHGNVNVEKQFEVPCNLLDKVTVTEPEHKQFKQELKSCKIRAP